METKMDRDDLLVFIKLLSNENNLDESSKSVPLITFGYELKDLNVQIGKNKIGWIDGVYLSLYGELTFPCSDVNGEFLDDFAVKDFPLGIIELYLTKLLLHFLP